MSALSETDKAHLKAALNSLPKARTAPYLDACKKNPFAALELYAWNIRVAAALHETLSHFEVSFRNQLDAALQGRHLYESRQAIGSMIATTS